MRLILSVAAILLAAAVTWVMYAAYTFEPFDDWNEWYS